ncbi:hypothetical protein BGZ46_000014 [Entomortierella lignicola]|nr:hypothetical protein BGZ46_000014 [Entomortierella lignicola]
MSRPRDIRTSTYSQNYQRNSVSGNTISTPSRHSELVVHDNTELDWRYLSTTETYSSEYSAASEEEDDEPIQAMIAASAKESNNVQSQRGTRPLLAASPPVTSGLFASSPGTTHEADDSTDTIKSMRARALDKINGRRESLSNHNGNNNSANNASGSSKRATLSVTGQGGSYLANRPSASMDDKGTSHESGQGTAIRVKRRSIGQSTAERSPITRANTKTSQQEPRHNIPVTQQSHIRKGNSGSFKSQQIPITSEDEVSSAKGSGQDRSRYATEGGGMLVSELKALKARVQELEMERMNRSLSGLDVQSSPQSLDLPTPGDQQSLSHSEKLQHIIQKHRGSAPSLESFNPSRSSVSSTLSASRQKSNRGSEGTIGDSSVKIESPLRTSSTPSTQHLDLLQGAFKTFEKVMSNTGSADAHSAVLSMSKVVSSAVSMNQTIRTWIKADVTLVDSSSMTSLQRACDEQIRNLTESLLAMASMQSTDRSFSQSDISPGDRPYSPRLSTSPQKFAQGQRLSLAIVGSELGARNGVDFNPPYPTRPLSAAAFKNYDTAGSITPNAMSSSGYWTSSISSGAATEPRVRANNQDSNRTLDSPQQRMAYSPGPEGSASDSSTQLARRQASIRNIMARYSQGGPRSPTFGQSNNDFESSNPLQYASGPDSQPSYEERPQGSGSKTRQQHISDRHYHSPQPSRDNSMSASVDFSSTGHVLSNRRPLSQQDHHSYSGSRVPTTPLVRQGSAVQRSGRYANDRVFSDDESIGGWGTASLDQLSQHRSKSGSYALRSQQLKGRIDQMQPLHQQLDRLENDQEFAQQQQHGGFSDDAEIDMFTGQRIPRFAQHRHSTYPQQHNQPHHSQQYHNINENDMQVQGQSHQHHQDMMMTTPSMPSPNSSPSSSSRLDAPSLASSNSHQGGLVGLDARYQLSPRGPPDSSTFPRQMSMGNISGFSDDGQYVSQPKQQKQPPSKRGTLANYRSNFQSQHHQQQSSHIDGMSPQAQARLQQVLAES